MTAISDVIAGYEGKAYISTDGGATLIEFAQLRKYDLNIQRDMLDAGTHATAAAGWKRKKPGMADWNGSCDLILASTDASEDAVINAINGATQVFFAFDPQGSLYKKPRRQGPGYIKDTKESSPYNEIATYSVSVEGDGQLVLTAVPLTVTAPAASVVKSAKLQLAINTPKQDDVTWAVTGGASNGTVNTTGEYTAPSSVPGEPDIVVTATHKTDTTVVASITLTVTES